MVGPIQLYSQGLVSSGCFSVHLFPFPSLDTPMSLEADRKQSPSYLTELFATCFITEYKVFPPFQVLFIPFHQAFPYIEP